MSLTSQRIFRIGLGVCLIAVSVLAFAPLEGPPLTHWDKTDHILAFAVLAWLAHGASPCRRQAHVGWGLLLGYGLLIEVVQHFLPYRNASALDLAADAVGILVYASAVAGLTGLGSSEAQL